MSGKSIRTFARSNPVTPIDKRVLIEALIPYEIGVRNDKVAGRVCLAPYTKNGGWPAAVLNDQGQEHDIDLPALIMPHMREGEVLVLLTSGADSEGDSYDWVEAYVRYGETIKRHEVGLCDLEGPDDIYDAIAIGLDVDEGTITRAE